MELTVSSFTRMQFSTSGICTHAFHGKVKGQRMFAVQVPQDICENLVYCTDLFPLSRICDGIYIALFYAGGKMGGRPREGVRVLRSRLNGNGGAEGGF